MTGYVPSPDVILAIDPARVSGWAIMRQGKVLASGTCKPGEECHAVRSAYAAANAHVADSKPRVVIETWTFGLGRKRDPHATIATILGLGRARGRWDAALLLHGLDALEVNVATWRGKVLGGGFGVSSDEWKRRSCAHARTRGVVTGDDNEADAIGIGTWATYALPEANKPRARKKTRANPA